MEILKKCMFFTQISGKKQVTLFDPKNNHQLYEGHIMEAKLAFNWTTRAFSRRHIRDFSNVVMSPVNIVRPDYTVSHRYQRRIQKFETKGWGPWK